MKLFTLHADAEAELRAAANTYEQREPGLAAEFLAEFEAALERIRSNPYLYAAEDESGIRHCPLHRFPYSLVYLDLGDQVWVVTVAHQHRRPGYWSRRHPD